MPDGKTTAPVPQEQKQLLKHAETVEQILARKHQVTELEDAVADLLEHYDMIKKSVTETGLHALIREKITAALGHESMEFIRSERRKAFEVIAGIEAKQETVPLITKIFGANYEFPEDNPKEAIRILKELLKQTEASSTIEDADINAIGDAAEALLETYNANAYPKDHGIIDGLVKNIYDLAKQRQGELPQGAAQPPAAAKPQKRRKGKGMSDEDRQRLDEKLEEIQKGIKPAKKPAKPAPKPAPVKPAGPTDVEIQAAINQVLEKLNAIPHNTPDYRDQISRMQAYAGGKELEGEDAKKYKGWERKHFESILQVLPTPGPTEEEEKKAREESEKKIREREEAQKKIDEVNERAKAMKEEAERLEEEMRKKEEEDRRMKVEEKRLEDEKKARADFEVLMKEKAGAETPKVDKMHELYEAAKEDEGLRKDLNVLKTLDEFRALSPQEVGDKAKALGLNWKPEYCKKITELAKKYLPLEEAITRFGNVPLDELKKKIKDAADDRRDAIETSNLDQSLIKYLQKKASMAPVEAPKKEVGKPKDDITTGLIKPYEFEPREMPKSVPNAILKDLAVRPVNNVNVFIKAWEIYKGAESDLDPKELKILKTHLAAMEKTAEKDDQESGLVIFGMVNDILKRFSDALWEAPKPKEKPKDREMRFLLEHILDDPDYSAKLKKIFDFNNLEAYSLENEREKYETEKIQQEIALVIYSEVMSLYSISKPTDEEKIKVLRDKRLIEQKNPEVIKPVKEKIDSLSKLIESFEAKQTDRKKKEKEEAEKRRMEEEEAENEDVIIPPPVPPKEPEGVGPAPAEKEEPIPSETKPAPKKPAGAPGAAAATEGAAEKESKPEAIEKLPQGLDTEIQNLMAEILVDKTFYKVTGRPKDKASLAIRELIISELKKEAGRGKEEKIGFSLTGLKGFLLKPNLTLTEAVNKYVGKSLIQLQLDLKEADRKIKNMNDNIATQKSRLGGGYSRKTAGDEQLILDDIKTKQEDLRGFEDEKDAITNAIAFKNGTMRYNSTEQVLAMVNVYLRMKLGQEKVAEKDFLKDVQKQIDTQTRSAHGAGGKWVNVAFGVLTGGGIFKPGLKSTLKNLEKDELLKKIGAEKFGQLAKFWDSRGNVEAWVQGLEGGTEHVMTALVPRIIAYLEMAIKDGNMTYMKLGSAYKAKGLVEHLTAIRHNYVLEKVEKNSQGLSDVDRMAMYFKELDKITVSRNKLTKKLIGRRAGLRALLTGGILGAGAATLILGGGILGITGLTAGIATGKLGHAAIKAKTPEQKAMYKKLATRVGLASGLGIAGAALSPYLIPLAAAGALAPELWKKRAAIGKGTWKTSKFIGRSGWWGVKAFLAAGLVLPLLTKWGRNVFSFGEIKKVFVGSSSTPLKT